MKVFVKTLKGTHFEIEVKLQDTVADVKKQIESSQGQSVYPSEQQMLIYQGKILKDETTLDENKVSENSFIVIMLSKTKGASSGASTTVKEPANQAPPTGTVPSNPPAPASNPPPELTSTLAPIPASAPTPTATAAPSSAVTISTETDAYDQAASNLVAGSKFEQTIQEILNVGGGTWDRDVVARALRAAYNNPERAVEYLYSGIPEHAEPPHVAPPVPMGRHTVNLPVASNPMGGLTFNPQAQVPQPVRTIVPSSGPNANPLDLFPQGLPSVGSNTGSGNLDFLRNSPQFRTLQQMVQANPQILQPMLQELAKQNPNIMSLIQEHQSEFLHLINEQAEGTEGNILGQQAAGTQQSVIVTREERDAIERLEAMGFDRTLVLEVFFACNKNEELAANYLLDHMHEFED